MIRCRPDRHDDRGPRDKPKTPALGDRGSVGGGSGWPPMDCHCQTGRLHNAKSTLPFRRVRVYFLPRCVLLCVPRRPISPQAHSPTGRLTQRGAHMGFSTEHLANLIVRLQGYDTEHGTGFAPPELIDEAIRALEEQAREIERLQHDILLRDDHR